jgi:hypothetical protein
MIPIPEKFEGITKGGTPKSFRHGCRVFTIDPKPFGDQTSLAEAIRTSYFQPENDELLVSIEDLQDTLGLREYPMRCWKAVEKGISGHLFEMPHGEAVFVPLPSGPADA